MATIAGLLRITGNAAAAYFADCFPLRIETIETAAGIFLIGGFALIGCALPAML